MCCGRVGSLDFGGESRGLQCVQEKIQERFGGQFHGELPRLQVLCDCGLHFTQLNIDTKDPVAVTAYIVPSLVLQGQPCGVIQAFNTTTPSQNNVFVAQLRHLCLIGKGYEELDHLYWLRVVHLQHSTCVLSPNLHQLDSLFPGAVGTRHPVARQWRTAPSAALSTSRACHRLRDGSVCFVLVHVCTTRTAAPDRA